MIWAFFQAKVLESCREQSLQHLACPHIGWNTASIGKIEYKSSPSKPLDSCYNSRSRRTALRGWLSRTASAVSWNSSLSRLAGDIPYQISFLTHQRWTELPYEGQCKTWWARRPVSSNRRLWSPEWLRIAAFERRTQAGGCRLGGARSMLACLHASQTSKALRSIY